MRTVFALLIVLFVSSTLNVQPGDTQVDLPEGAIARLNHGNFDLETVAFNPDSTILASGGGDEVQLWNVRTGILNHTIDGLGWVRSLAFSPNGTMLAIGLSNTILHLWNVAPASHIKQLEQSTVGFYDMAFSPDGTMLAVGSEDSRGTDSLSVVHLWDVSTSNYRIIRTLTGHTKGQSINRVLSVAFSPDGTTLAGGSVDGKVRLWDVSNWTLKSTLEHGDGVEDLAYSPDGTTIVTASGGYLHTWDVSSGTLKKRFRHGWAGDPLWSVAYSPDGTTIASGGGRGTDAALWDPETGAVKKRLAGNNGSVLSVAYSPDGTLLATGGATSGAPDSVVLWGLTPSVPTPAMAPEFTEGSSATRAIAENTQLGVNIGTPVAATDADNDTLTYTLSGTDANAFSLDTTTGQLRTRAALDYETKSTYTLTITVSDGNLIDIINVTVNVTNMADDPVNVTNMADDPVSSIFSYIYWTDAWACKIQRANLSGANIEDLVPQVCPSKIAVDIARGKMYWTESTLFSKIRRANLDGSNVEDLVTQNRDTAPEFSGIALDVAGDKMYWIDGRKIRRANLNGTNIQDIVSFPEGRTHWADIALDVVRGKLYWADGDKIYRVNLDGSNMQEIHDLWTIDSIALDVVGGKIYYSDGGNIRYSDLDGSNRDSIVISGSRGTVVGDMALDIAGGKIYWVGAAHHVGEGILSVNLDGTNMQLLVTTEAEEVREPNSLALSIPQTTETPGTSNKVPVFTEGDSATRTIAENTAGDINIDTPVAATDADNDTLTYTLSGTDANAFSLDTTTGQLRTRAALDHETKSVYTLIITASDGKLTDSITVTINITDIDEPELVTTPSTSDDTDNAQDSTQWHLPEGASARLGKGIIEEIAYSPDGGRLAVASGIGIWIYDAFTGAEVALFRGHTRSVLGVAYSPDGRTLATTSYDDTVRLWDTATGTLENTLTGGVYSVAYSRDGSTLATGGYRDARLWDAATGTLKNTLEHANSATKVIFSPDGSTLATRGFNGTVRLWDTITGTLKNTLEHTTFVDSVAYSPDGATLATGGSNEIYLWDATSGTLKSTLEAAGWIYSIAYSPDGRTFAANGYSFSNMGFRPEVHLWDAATGTLIRKLTGQRGSFGIITYSRDGRTLASASTDVVYLWDAATGALIQKLTGHTGSVYGTAYHPNERTLASAHYNGLLHLWDAATGNFINTHADGGNLYSIAYSPNGRTVAGGGYERVYLWDADNGNLINTLEGHTSDVDSIAYSPDGSTLATGSEGEVRLWDAATGTLTNTLEHPGSVKSLAYSPDGATLATGSDDRTARLWDAVTGTLTNTLTGHTNWVNSVAYSPGGAMLATGSGREVRLWDAATGTLTNTLIGPHDVIYSIAYSPDGRTLASGNYNGAVRLWDMTTHTLLQTLMGHTGVVYSVAYSPDGSSLATGSEDGTVLLWNLAPAADVYPAWDVNEDGQTSVADLIVIVAAFEKTPIVNPRTDVNGDGKVDKQDIIIVAAHLGESTTPAAPISVALPERLTPETLRQALDLLRAHNDGSFAFQRGIAHLEQLLASLIPKTTALLANYPNPFNPETWIPYELANSADVSVRIYSVNGSLVRRLSLGHQAAGMYRSRSRSAYWDGKNELGESVASGVYFYTLTAEDFTATRKMLIRK